MISFLFMVVAAIVAMGFLYRSPKHLLFFALATGLFRFGGDAGELAGGSIDFSSIWLLIMIILCALALMRSHVNLRSMPLPAKFYGLFLAWCILEALRAPDPLFSLRLFLKLLYPLLIMLLAASVIHNPREVVKPLKWLIVLAVVASFIVGGIATRFYPSIAWTPLTGNGLMIAAAMFADYASLIGILSLVCFWLFRQYRYGGFWVLLGLSSVLMAVRTGILAIVVGSSIFFPLALGKVKGIPLMVGMYAVLIAGLLLAPQLREKTFFDHAKVQRVGFDTDESSTEDINSSGRFTMWGVVLTKFWEPNPFFGSGLGATQLWFYHGNYWRMKVEHSEYVRLLSDTGLVGLGLYLAMVISCVVQAVRAFYREREPVTRACALFVVCAFPALLVCMAFDNVINYVLASGQYVFAFVGIVAGLTQRASRQPISGMPREAQCLRRP